jgi:hypothetical protein
MNGMKYGSVRGEREVCCVLCAGKSFFGSLATSFGTPL